MDRRDILQLGGLLGFSALGGGAACLPRGLPRRLPDSEIGKVISTMDESLAQISRYDMLDDFSRRSGTKGKYSDEDRSLSEMAVRAMYTSAYFRSLPEEAQLHPAMQERMFGQLASMDQAVYGMTDRMSTLREDQRDFVKAALNDKRTAPEVVSQTFDKGMGALAMPLGRRFQVRNTFSKIGWRLQKHPALVIDEYVTKVNKATALVGSQVELQRRIAAQMGQEAYWRHQNTLALMMADDPGGSSGPTVPMPTGPGPSGPPGGSGAPAMAPPPVDTSYEVQVLMSNVRFAAARNQCETVEFLGKRIADLDPATYRSAFLTDQGVIACRQYMREKAAIDRSNPMAPPAQCEDPRAAANKMARDKVVGTGGWMLGIGLVTGLLSALLASAGSGAEVLGVIGITVAAGLLVGGLVVVIVGAAMASS
jgi:hypothetical protein